MFKAFGYSIDQNGDKLIRQMAAVCTSEPIDVIDLGTFDPELSKDDIVFVFGKKAELELGDRPAKLKLVFPEYHKLDATFGEDEERELAYQQLLKLKKFLSSGDRAEPQESTDKQCTQNTITEEVLPELTASEILSHLKAALRKEGTKEWLGSTKGGKLVRLTLDREEGKADINMTFAELYFIRLAMETLQVKELEIVYKPGINQQGGSYGSRSSNDR